MIHNREFELDLVSHSLKKPLYLKQNKLALAKLKFQDPLIDLIYKAVMTTVIDNNTVPTMSELQLDLANRMDANERYNFFEKEVVHDTIKAIYERETTDMTGLTISKYLMEKAARELADNLGSDKGDSLISNLAKYEHELAKIKHMFADSEDLGHNVFSAEGMEHWKKLLDDYNNAACIPTHFPVLDYCLQGGIRRGELAVILAPTGVGKAQPLTSSVLTPTGYRKMGELLAGDLVIDWKGNAVKIKGIFPQGIKKNYKVTFDDGTSVECCDEHLWWARSCDASHKKYKVYPLKTMLISGIIGSKNRSNWFVPVMDAISYEEKELPVDSYILGALLGDGGLTEHSPRLTSADPELVDHIKKMLPTSVVIKKYGKGDIDYGFSSVEKVRNPITGVLPKNELTIALISLNLMGTNSHTKFIPEEYQYGSVDQRIELLRGLCDTDGTISSCGTCVDYCCASEQLVKDIQILVRGLGGICGPIKHKVVKGNTYYRIRAVTKFNPFRLSRKADKWRLPIKEFKKSIRSVEYIGETEMQCIAVDSPTASYITEGHTVTHNTSCLLNFTMNFVKNGQRILYIVLDNLEGDMAIRTMGCLLDIDVTQGLNADATIDAARMGYYDQCENNLFYKHFVPKELNKAKLERYLDKFQTHLYELDKQANIKDSEEWGQIDGLVIDYLDEMSTEYTDNGWETASNLSQEVKAVLKARNIFGLTATQGGTEAMKSDTIKLHMAQGFKSKFNAPDLIFAISQDDSEKAMNPSVFRLGCLKARRGRSHYQIQFNFWKERQLIKEVPNATILTMSSERTTENGAKPVATNNYSSMYGIKDNLTKHLGEQETTNSAQLDSIGGEEVKSEGQAAAEISP